MILFLTDPSRAQDYLADQLYDGFRSWALTTGYDRAVLDWPQKPSLHWGERLVMDCDFDWPIIQPVASPKEWRADLIVIPNRAIALAAETREVLKPMAARVVLVDGEDDTRDRLPHFIRELGFAPRAYFKREIPLSDVGTFRVLDTLVKAQPLPFAYPARRITPIDTDRVGLFASWQIWPWAKGQLREVLMQKLHELACEWEAQPIRAHGWYEGETRPTPREYHEELSKSAITIAPAGAGYFTNRLFEAHAAGCAVIRERATVQFPNEGIPGVTHTEFTTVAEAVRQAQVLLNNPDEARTIARMGQSWLRNHHTTEHRAREVWAVVHG